MFNNVTQEFVEIQDTVLMLEHSLLSLKKWEERWMIPFLATKDKTLEQIYDYIYCMILNKEEIPREIVRVLTQEQITSITKYIEAPMTATTFSNNALIGAQSHRGEIITAEIVYCWMVMLRIPIELETWHLNQLMTLIRVVNLKSGGEKKMSPKEAALQRKMLNEQRKAKYKTRG